MPETVALEILLDDVDVTAYCALNLVQPVITSALDEELDTLILTLQAADAIAPTEWQEIVINDNSVKIFGGYVMTVEKFAAANAALNDYVLGCSDYGCFLGKVFVKAEYEDYTDAQIIAAAFASSDELAGFDVSTFIGNLTSFERVRFNRKSVRDILDWICLQTGGHWYVDYDKKVHYFGTEEFSSNYDVTDDPTQTSKVTVEGVRISTNGASVVNLVEVVGGSDLSDDVVDNEYLPNGVSVTIDLKHRYKPATGESGIGVRRNDGGPTTNLVVNPSFEVNITDGWTQLQSGSGAAWAQDAVKFNKGTKSLKMTAGTALSRLHTANLTLAPGETLTVQAMTWCNTLEMSTLAIWDSTGSAVLSSTTNRKTSAWEQLTASYTNTSGADKTVRVELRNNGTDSAQIVYFDGVQAEKKTWPTAYCDGSLGTGYAWTGTANNSTSTRVDMPVWTDLSVKTGGTDTLSARNVVLYYERTARLEQETPWPGIANSVEVTGRYETPMRTRVRNQASHDHYGKWLEGIVNAPEIVNKAIGQMRGKAELAQNAFANPAISYTSREPGLRAGMTQNISLNARGVVGSYLIQRVTTTIGVAGFVTAAVELGAVDQSLVGLLLALKRAGVAEIEWNENEVLDELLDSSEYLHFIAETTSMSADKGPYHWDSGDRWNFAAWREWKQSQAESLAMDSESTSVDGSTAPYVYGTARYGFAVWS